VTSIGNQGSLTDWAAQQSQRLLRNELAGRRLHSRAVGLKAARLARHLETDGDVLVAAAYLHDIGYAFELRRTEFHPLDGALHLRDSGHYRVACLVAHHSSSEYAADLLGLTRQLRSFPLENSLLVDALTYCDMTTDLNGREVSLDERLLSVTARYGGNHPIAQALDNAEPCLRASVKRVEEWLATQSNLVCGSLAR
jgi:putative nucleotidyltransferase with HDIG domain